MALESLPNEEIIQTEFYSDNIGCDLLQKLNRDRNSTKELCDVIIRVGKCDFHAHKCMLSAFTNIVQKKNGSMITTKRNDIVFVNDVSENLMEVLINFMYTGKLTITNENVSQLYAAAQEFDIPYIKEHCAEFLCKIVNSKNCLMIRQFATLHKIDKLLEQAESCFISENFDLVLKQDQFKELPLDGILSLLQLKNKKASSEEAIYKAVIEWILCDESNRAAHFDELFHLLDLDKMSEEFLQETVVEEDRVRDNPSHLRKIVKSIARRFPNPDDEENRSKNIGDVNFPEACLYIGDLHYFVTEEILHETFSSIGEIDSVQICRDSEGKSRGFGFIIFEDIEDAEIAIEKMNFHPIRGRPIHITWSQNDPSLMTSSLGCIFIKNLPPSMHNEALYESFTVFGRILSCKVTSPKENNFLRFGFVHFETDEAAQLAVQVTNGMELDDRKVVVGSFKTQAERGKIVEDKDEGFISVYVKNFSNKLDEKELEELFKDHGEIANVTVMRDDKGNSRGFGFVNFKNQEDAKRSIEALNGTKVKGTNAKLFVGPKLNKKERQAELQSQYQEKYKEKTNNQMKPPPFARPVPVLFPPPPMAIQFQRNFRSGPMFQALRPMPHPIPFQVNPNMPGFSGTKPSQKDLFRQQLYPLVSRFNSSDTLLITELLLKEDPTLLQSFLKDIGALEKKISEIVEEFDKKTSVETKTSSKIISKKRKSKNKA